ncbi:MAG: hypothetical protein AAF420_01950 [Pseudomonadota bacterium]
MADQYQLGRHGDVISVDTAEDIVAHLVRFAGQSRRLVQLFSPTLTHALYNDARFIEALSKSIRENRRKRVQILLSNPSPSISRGHRMVALAEKLSSYIEIRRTHKDFQNISNEYLLADKRAYLFRPNAERYTCDVCYNDPLTTDSYYKRFLEIWESSTREREFLRLHI